ncbi:hypothetical protein TWF281_004308 [Arthrobotrys megalospora]
MSSKTGDGDTTRITNEVEYRQHGAILQCLDQREVFKRADESLLDPSLRNIVIDYGPDTALYGTNFTLDAADTLIGGWNNRKPLGLKTRWIAIFDAHKQREFVLAVLEQYKLSTRLKESLLSAPGKGNLEIARKLWHWSCAEQGERFRAVGLNTLYDLDILEIAQDKPKGVVTTRGLSASRKWWRPGPTYKASSTSVLPTSEPSKDEKESRTHREMVVSSSHSTDESILRYNHEDKHSSIHYHPRMLRLWVWILLADDGTVVSIHEPLPDSIRGNGRHEKRVLSHIRKNLRVILRCLSEVRISQHVETPSQDTDVAIEEGAVLLRKTDGPTGDLLFYYLFDDWYTAWSIVLEREHPYSRDLNRIREQDPQLENIDALHDIVRRLASLKRIYQSYELVLERLLQEGKDFYRDSSPLAFKPAAASRFARLKYRIRYLAITEIEDCEMETQGLISLTYNRLNFRETQAVEKLSLLSVTLAKVAIIFLPLSLITSYFSMDVQGISGTATKKDFWISSGVTVFLTLGFLVFVNHLSKALQTGKR